MTKLPRLLLVVLVLIIGPTPAPSLANDWKIIPAERIGDVTLGMPVADLLAALGPPTWAYEAGAASHRFWETHLLSVTVASNSIESISTTWFRGRAQPFKTEKGIGLGATAQEVRDAYRDDEVVTSAHIDPVSGDRQDILSYANLGVSFFVQQSPDSPPEIRGRVWAMKVSLPGSRSLATPPGLPFSPTRAHDWKIIPGERIGDIKLSMSIDDIVNVLGTPSAIERDATTGTTYRWWPNHLINVTIPPGSPSTAPVEVISTRWLDGRAHPYQIDKGIGIKTTEEQVREAYRGEAVVTGSNADGVVLVYENVGIFFSIFRRRDVPEDMRGRVWGIGIFRKGGVRR